MLKNLVRGLLTGDFPPNLTNDEMIALLMYAYQTISDEADALHLFTLNKIETDIYRQAIGDYVIRFPELPKSDDDELDIDSELVPAVARYIASYLSKEKMVWHEKKAKEIINNYNAKVAAFFEKAKQRISEAEVNEIEDGDYVY
jgi:hypothetical protein